MVQAQGTTCLKNKSHQRDWHPENKGRGLKGQTVQAWWGFSFISSGSQGQSEGSTVRFVFCKKIILESSEEWREGKGPGLVETRQKLL